MILVVGEINDTNRRLVQDYSPLCWIDPTKNMSLFQVNWFMNEIEDLEIVGDSKLLIWTNQPHLIDILSDRVKQVFVVDGKIEKISKDQLVGKTDCLSLSSLLYRNWI